jgi:hypothetical protein
MNVNVPKLFIRYSKSHPSLIRQRKEFVHFLSGGMAVKFYLHARKIPAQTLVRKTSDFDFVFAVPELKNMDDKFKLMYAIMFKHVKGFKEWLMSEYKIPSEIHSKILVPPVRYNPITGKRIYKVCQFEIEIAGRKPEGLVDATLTYIPGVRRNTLLTKYTKQFGMPIQKVNYLYKGVLKVLVSSFSEFAKVDKSLASRNPLTGTRAEKGAKNVKRLENLLKANVSATTAVRKFLKNIESRRTESAFKNANKIIKQLKEKSAS